MVCAATTRRGRCSRGSHRVNGLPDTAVAASGYISRVNPQVSRVRARITGFLFCHDPALFLCSATPPPGEGVLKQIPAGHQGKTDRDAGT